MSSDLGRLAGLLRQLLAIEWVLLRAGGGFLPAEGGWRPLVLATPSDFKPSLSDFSPAPGVFKASLSEIKTSPSKITASPRVFKPSPGEIRASLGEIKAGPAVFKGRYVLRRLKNSRGQVILTRQRAMGAERRRLDISFLDSRHGPKTAHGEHELGRAALLRGCGRLGFAKADQQVGPTGFMGRFSRGEEWQSGGVLREPGTGLPEAESVP